MSEHPHRSPHNTGAPFSSMDFHWMKRALALARHGGRSVRPNPLVGAILVRNNTVLGEGFHRAFGGAHAEIEAMNAAEESLEQSTLYVTLEPCNHWGHTGPCVDAVISRGCSAVVIASRDPNPHVTGGGAERLLDAGLDVRVGCLEQQARELNRGWFSLMEQGRPLVAVHLYSSLDGRSQSLDELSRLWMEKSGKSVVLRGLRAFDAVLCGAEDSALSASFDALLVGTNVKKYLLPMDQRTPNDIAKFLQQVAADGVQSVFCSGNSELGISVIESGLCDRFIVRHALAFNGDSRGALFPDGMKDRYPNFLSALWAHKMGNNVVSCYKAGPASTVLAGNVKGLSRTV